MSHFARNFRLFRFDKYSISYFVIPSGCLILRFRKYFLKSFCKNIISMASASHGLPSCRKYFTWIVVIPYLLFQASSCSALATEASFPNLAITIFSKTFVWFSSIAVNKAIRNTTIFILFHCSLIRVWPCTTLISKKG